MKFPMKAGTHAFVGSMPITFITDTEVDIAADSMDHIAEMMASSGGQRAFGEHLEALKHNETITRNIDGVPHEVDVDISYGAGGARIETNRGEPRKIGEQRAEGGIGTETVPGASGVGESFEANRGGAAPVASEDGQDVETARLRSVPRTEFVVPPKRFPDEVQTATDPPRSELVADSPERATPYVGEYTQTGAFSRQPSLDHAGGYPYPEGVGGSAVDRAEGRPAPTPDTPGTRDREFPAPSQAAKERPDQTAVALNVAEKGSSQLGEGGQVANEKTGAEDDLSDLNDENVSPDESDDLPEEFPHSAELEAAGVTKWSQLEGLTAEDLAGPDYKGIGEVKAGDILAEVKKKKRRDAYRAKKKQQ